MILAVTLNAAVDKTLVVPRLKLNGRFYSERMLAMPGGKGINVARVLHTLGSPVKVLGFSAGHNGWFIYDQLRNEGLEACLVDIPGESRLCLTLVDDVEGTHTEINEPGPAIQPPAVSAFLDAYRFHLAAARAVVLSGSIPPGVPESIYRTCIEQARAAGRLVLLDAKDGPLREGLQARPDYVKPNREELSGWLGEPLSTVDDVVRHLHRLEGQAALISLGAEGAVLSTPQVRLHGWLQKGHAVSAVGSGDAMVAAFLWGLLQERSAADCLRLAVAAGLSNTWHLGAGTCTSAEMRELYPLVRLRAL